MSRTRLIAAFAACLMAAGTSAFAQAEGSTLLRRSIARFNANDSTNTRIVGGQRTTIAQNPWQVALVHASDPNNSRAQFCGGSRVHAQWVLTAAHCVDKGTKPEQVAVLAGTDSLLAGGRRLRVVEIFVHERWNTAPHDFDMALLRLHPQDAQAGDPIIRGVAAGFQPAVGQAVRVTGWGVTEDKPQGTDFLMVAEPPYVTNEKCKDGYGSAITDNMLCAGLEGGSVDSCQGDSGGPASVALSPGDRRLVGVVSWGDGCGEPLKYGVYSRVTQFVPWINLKTGGAVSW